MDFSKIPLIRMMTTRMQSLGQRQTVLSQNVVNADTPGYRAKDVEMPNFRRVLAGQAVRRPALAVTHAGHIRPPRSEGPAKVIEVDRSGNQPISIETEMMKVAETAMDYQIITNLYRRQVAMIRMALGRGGR